MERERLIKEGIRVIYNDYVGGLINTILDSEKGSEEYNIAMEELYNPDFIKKSLYTDLMKCPVIELGYGLVSLEKDIRFYGKQNIERLISDYVDKHIEEDQNEIDGE